VNDDGFIRYSSWGAKVLRKRQNFGVNLRSFWKHLILIVVLNGPFFNKEI